MPSLSMEDYNTLLPKITTLETKILRLEVNMEVNGLCENDSTLPFNYNSNNGQELTSTKKTALHQRDCVTSTSPPWNSLGAKPKNKSLHCDIERHVTGRIQRPEICDETGWPALSSSSTPVRRKAQPWITARGKTSETAPKQPHLQLQNRFTPLPQDPGSSSDGLDNLSVSQKRCHTAPSAKDTRQDKPKQREGTSKPEKHEEPTLPGGKAPPQPASIGHEDSRPPTLQTPPRSLSSLNVTSLFYYQLEFTDQMNKLVTAALQLTPHPSLIFSPKILPRLSQLSVPQCPPPPIPPPPVPPGQLDVFN